MKQSNLYSFFAVGNNKKRERDDEVEKVSQTRRHEKMTGAAEKENSNPIMQEESISNDSVVREAYVDNQIVEGVRMSVNMNSLTTARVAANSNSVVQDKLQLNDSVMIKASEINELSDYELVRLQNIRRNEEFLASLGLQGPSSIARLSVIKTTPKAKQASNHNNSENEALPTRRSARVASTPADANKYVADNMDAGEVEEEEVEEEKIYDDSDVIRYVMDNKYSDKHATRGSNRIQYYHPINMENTISSPDLPAIYSMEYHPQYCNMLLAGGKGGYVSLFKMPGSQLSASPLGGSNKYLLFSWRAHNRWISTVKFLNYNSPNKVTVISAADDATIKIWDMGTKVTTTSSKANSITPQLLASYDSIHDKGVYSLDISPDQTRLVTGSKDKTIAISTITESMISNTLILNELHHSVVKTVAFHTMDNNLIASGGQDRRVSIKDLRANGAPDIIVDGVHNGGVHTVFFNRNNGGNILVTAGFDPVINLFDIRRPKEPLFRLIGHHSSSTKTHKTILTPAIVTPSNSSEFIIATGEGNDMLSLYDVSSGKTVSRGSCGVGQPGSIAVKHDGTNTVGLSFRSKSLAGSILELQATTEPV